MHPEFWHERWRSGRIGFHQTDYNETLTRVWPTLGLPAGSRVLVPLCGKTRDLLWLRDAGYDVIGVELSPVACAAFFEENGLTATTGPFSRFHAWRSERITLLQGDVFDLPPDLAVDAVYDRAATIALPRDLRVRYAQTIGALTRPETPLLLVTLDYPQAERDGPPFAVPPADVERLYGVDFDVKHLGRRPGAEPQRLAWGVSHLASHDFLLRRRAD